MATAKPDRGIDLSRLRQWLPFAVLAVLVALVGALDPSFLRPEALMQIAADVSTLFIMALGITFVIYIGGIDLSSQAIANMTTVLVTLLLPTMGWGVALFALLVGATFGATSGLITTRFMVPSFITTLAMGGVALSVAQFASGQRALFMNAELRAQAFGWMTADIGPVPVELVLAGVILLVCLFLERKTVFGRALKAIGAAELAASASGLRVRRYKVAAFALSGGLAAAAGLLFAVKLSGGSPTMAEGLLLPAITAVLVGGTPLTGGVGGVLNTLIGALIVAVVRTSMLYLEIPAQAQQIFFGLVLIIAIAGTIDRSKVRTVK
jgi:ribose transport system permease protein